MAKRRLIFNCNKFTAIGTSQLLEVNGKYARGGGYLCLSFFSTEKEYNDFGAEIDNVKEEYAQREESILVVEKPCIKLFLMCNAKT